MAFHFKWHLRYLPDSSFVTAPFGKFVADVLIWQNISKKVTTYAVFLHRRVLSLHRNYKLLHIKRPKIWEKKV